MLAEADGTYSPKFLDRTIELQTKKETKLAKADPGEFLTKGKLELGLHGRGSWCHDFATSECSIIVRMARFSKWYRSV